jgi:hypothetical protein
LNGATGVPTTIAPTVTFNESVIASSINFVLRDPGGNLVTTTFGYDDVTHTATLTPATELVSSTTYVATVSGATDANINTMTGFVSWSFTTAPAFPGEIRVWDNSVTPGVTAVEEPFSL